MDEIREALSKRSGPLTWPLETEYGRVRDFREYVCKSERALGGDVRVTVPDDTNEYVTALVTQGKIGLAEAAYTAINARLFNDEWQAALTGEYWPGPHGESYITLPDAAGMKKLLRDAHPARNFDVDPEKRSRQRQCPQPTRRKSRDDNTR